MLQALASAIGKGVLAGAAGTAAMSASSAAEMKIRGRQGSTVPAEVLCTLLGVEALDAAHKARLTTLVHWGYGTALGVSRGALALAGLRGRRAAAAFFGVTWAGELVMLPAVDAAPPPTRWSAQTLAVGGFHHLVYALVTSATYDALDRA